MNFSNTVVAMEVIALLKKEYDTLPDPVKEKLEAVMDLALDLNDLDTEKILETVRPLAKELKRTHPRLAALLE